MDSIPLPDLDIPRQKARNRVIGMTRGGWMHYDGRWKLCKYSTGETLLFDLAEDPTEQRNLMKDRNYWEQYLKLDAQLTQEIMRSVSLSHDERRVYGQSLYSDPQFGKAGWQRRKFVVANLFAQSD